MSQMKYPTVSFLVALAATVSLAGQDIVAVKAGKLITISGAAMSDAVVLIENGKIKAIGNAKDVEVPWDAKVVDANKQVVMPTYVLAGTPCRVVVNRYIA